MINSGGDGKVFAMMKGDPWVTLTVERTFDMYFGERNENNLGRPISWMEGADPSLLMKIAGGGIPMLSVTSTFLL